MPQTATRRSHELQEIPTPSERRENGRESVTPLAQTQELGGHALPSCDGGRAAWTMLLVAFVFEALLWGYPLAFGVFQDYYSQLPEFRDHPYISLIGTTASGIAYLAAPIMIPLVKRFPKYRRRMIWFGWPLCLMGIATGSFVRTVEALLFTQGILYGVGFVTFYYPILSLVNEFWIARRGMAYGLLCSASGVSGAAMPFVLESLLQRYGYQITLRAVAAGLFVLTAPLIPLLRGRIPDSEASEAAQTDWSFLGNHLFWAYSASNFAMGLGYFLPLLYLPTYASSNGLSSPQAASLLATMSISQVLGQLSFGYLSDQKLPLNLLVVSSTVVAALSAYFCWGLGHNLKVLIIFSLTYGFFGAGYTATWARMGTTVSREPTAAFTAFGLLNFGKGLGNVASGAIGGALLTNTIDIDSYAAARYKGVVLFTGSCMLLSAASIIFCYFRISIFGHVPLARTRA